MRRLGSALMKTPSAKSRFFPAGKAQGQHWAKLYWTYRKVNVGLATPPDAKRRLFADGVFMRADPNHGLAYRFGCGVVAGD